MKAIHYCGDGVFAMLPGWPVCGSGDFAYKVRDDGNQTPDVNSVTCKKCLSKMTKSGLIDYTRKVTVCDNCLQASCWQGEFMCEEAKSAGTTEKTVKELKELNRENPHYWE